VTAVTFWAKTEGMVAKQMATRTKTPWARATAGINGSPDDNFFMGGCSSSFVITGEA
jgi:hypothetical protein